MIAVVSFKFIYLLVIENLFSKEQSSDGEVQNRLRDMNNVAFCNKFQSVFRTYSEKNIPDGTKKNLFLAQHVQKVNAFRNSMS